MLLLCVLLQPKQGKGKNSPQYYQGAEIAFLTSLFCYIPKGMCKAEQLAWCSTLKGQRSTRDLQGLELGRQNTQLYREGKTNCFSKPVFTILRIFIRIK